MQLVGTLVSHYIRQLTLLKWHIKWHENMFFTQLNPSLIKFFQEFSKWEILVIVFMRQISPLFFSIFLKTWFPKRETKKHKGKRKRGMQKTKVAPFFLQKLVVDLCFLGALILSYYCHSLNLILLFLSLWFTSLLIHCILFWILLLNLSCHASKMGSPSFSTSVFFIFFWHFRDMGDTFSGF